MVQNVWNKVHSVSLTFYKLVRSFMITIKATMLFKTSLK